MAGGNNQMIYSKMMEFHEKMNSFRADEKYCDVSILVGGERFKCHRVVLASASEFFDKMFGGNFKESTSSEVSLKEMDVISFKEILNFIYTGNIKITGKSVYGLIEASEFLQLEYVGDLCCAYVKCNTPAIQDQDVINILLFACNTRKLTLINIMIDYVAKRFSEILKLEKSLVLPFRVVQSVLKQQRNLQMDDEVIADFIVKWVKRDVKREKFLSDLLQEIDTKKVSSDFMAKLFSAYVHVHREEPENACDIENNEEVIDDTIFFDEIDLCPASASDKSLEICCVTERQNCVIAGCAKRHRYISVYTLKGAKQWKFVKNINVENDFHCYSISYKSVIFGGQRYNLLVTPSGCQFSVDRATPAQQTLKLKNLTAPELNVIYSPDANLIPLQGALVATRTAIYSTYNFNQDTNFGPNDPRIHKYNCDTDKWYPIPLSQSYDSVHFFCLASSDSSLYTLGGFPGSDGLSCAEFYDERSGTWNSLPKMNAERFLAAACVHNGKIYVTGGTLSSGSNFEVYDPVAGKWQLLAPAPQYVFGHILIPYQGSLWSMGGYLDGEIIKLGGSVFLYDPQKNAWSSFDVPRELQRATMLGAIVL